MSDGLLRGRGAVYADGEYVGEVVSMNARVVIPKVDIPLPIARRERILAKLQRRSPRWKLASITRTGELHITKVSAEWERTLMRYFGIAPSLGYYLTQLVGWAVALYALYVRLRRK